MRGGGGGGGGKEWREKGGGREKLGNAVERAEGRGEQTGGREEWGSMRRLEKCVFIGCLTQCMYGTPCFPIETD